MKIYNKTYDVCSTLNKKIVLISDLHYENKKDINRLNSILENIKNIYPDFICIAGDIINKHKITDEDLFLDWLKKLSTTNKVIISIGNHEFYINKGEKIFGLNRVFLKKISNIKNVYLLDNDNVVIDNINFMGITIPIEYYGEEQVDNIKFLLSSISTKENLYNILLCHCPMYISKDKILKDSNINLVLCGHMHGGVVPKFLRPIFKNNGLVSPNKKLFPKNAYGSIKISNTDIIVTSGIKVLPNNFLTKFFAPEVVCINLNFSENNV